MNSQKLKFLIKRRDNLAWFISVMHEFSVDYRVHSKVMTAYEKVCKEIENIPKEVLVIADKG
jgi:hypothetical protein